MTRPTLPQDTEEMKLRPSLEEMNARQRRDGREFKVYAWSEELQRWIGIEKNSGNEWFPTSWQDDGNVYKDRQCDYDLIEKPVVEEWSVDEACIYYVGAEEVEAKLLNYFRRENGVTKLIKVEVINDE